MGSHEPIDFATESPIKPVDLDALRLDFPCPTCMGVGFTGLYSAMRGEPCPTCEGSGIDLPASGSDFGGSKDSG